MIEAAALTTGTGVRVIMPRGELVRDASQKRPLNFTLIYGSGVDSVGHHVCVDCANIKIQTN